MQLGDRPIGKIVIGGVESDGMLASGAELGINRDAAGILELNVDAGAAIPGCSPDSIVEIDNKSLTHRPDLWGHYGLAREVAALVDGILRDPVKLDRLPAGPPPIGVVIKDFDLCPRYSALAFKNATIAPSPLWLQHRLSAIGLRRSNRTPTLPPSPNPAARVVPAAPQPALRGRRTASYASPQNPARKPESGWR